MFLVIKQLVKYLFTVWIALRVATKGKMGLVIVPWFLLIYFIHPTPPLAQIARTFYLNHMHAANKREIRLIEITV